MAVKDYFHSSVPDFVSLSLLSYSEDTHATNYSIRYLTVSTERNEKGVGRMKKDF